MGNFFVRPASDPGPPSWNLKATVHDLEGTKCLKAKGKTILKLLKKGGPINLIYHLEALREMVKKAKCLMKSPLYLQIIQEMVEIQRVAIYEEIEWWPEVLECLVDEVESHYLFDHLCSYQEQLLSLIQILVEIDNSSHARTRILRILILNAQYVTWKIGGLRWTEQFVATLGLLLDGGANPAWIPDDAQHWSLQRSSDEGSAQLNFVLKMPLILAHNNSMSCALMALLKSFLKEIVDWLELRSNTDCHDIHGQTVLQILSQPVLEIAREDFLELVNCLKSFSYLDSQDTHRVNRPKALNSQDKYRQPVLHIASQRILELGHEDLLELVVGFKLHTNVDSQDEDGQTILHILSQKIPEISHEDFLKLVNCLKSPSNVDSQDKDGKTVLHILSQMVSEIDHEQFLELVSCLKSPSNVDSQDKDGQTVLHILSQRVSEIDHEKFLEFINCLKSTSNVDSQDEDGKTVLHILAQRVLEIGHGNFLKLASCLKSPSNVDSQDEDGQTVLHILLQKVSDFGHEEFLKLVSCLKSASNYDMQDKEGQTVLHILMQKVSEIGDGEFLELVGCLKSPSNVDSQDEDGKTVLHILSQRVLEIGHDNFLKLVNCLKSPSSVDSQDEDGQTVLHILLQNVSDLGHEEFLKLVNCLKSTSNVDSQDKDGKTVLHILSQRVLEIGHDNLLELVNCLKSPSSVDSQDEDGQTVLHIFLQNVSYLGHEEFLKLVNCLKSTSNMDSQDKDGQTVLHILVQSVLEIGHSEFLELVNYLKSPFNVDSADRYGQTALHVLLQKVSDLGHQEFLELVSCLKSALNVDMQDEEGKTVLHTLVQKVSEIGDREFLELVNCLKSPSNLDIQDKEGQTVLHILSQRVSKIGHKGFLELVSCLKSPSNVDSKNIHEETVLHILSQKVSEHGLAEFTESVNCLKSPFNVNSQDADGQTVLHILSKRVLELCHEDLLELANCLQCATNEGQTVIPILSQRVLRIGYVEFLSLVNCLKTFFNVDIQDKNKETILHILARKVSELGHNELVLCLTSSSIGTYNIQDIRGQSVLHILVEKVSELSHEAFLELANHLKSSPIVDIQNESGWTVLHILAEKVCDIGHQEFIKLVKCLRQSFNTDYQEEFGRTVLHILAIKVSEIGCKEFIELVDCLRSYSSVDIQEKSGWTVLHILSLKVTEIEYKEFIKVVYCIRSLSCVDIQIKFGWTVLHILAKKVSDIGHKEFTELVYCLRASCNIAIQEEFGRTVLHILAIKVSEIGCKEFIKLVNCLRSSSSVDIQEEFGRTVLHILAMKVSKIGYKEFIKLVNCLRSFSSADIEDGFGCTVLHTLAQQVSEIGYEGFMKLVNCLSVTKLKSRWTVLHILALKVSEIGHKEFVNLRNCIFPTANIDTQDEYGRTVLHILGKKSLETEYNKEASANPASGDLVKQIYRLVGEEFSNRRFQSDRHDLLSQIKVLAGWCTLTDGDVYYLAEYKQKVWENLWRISNAKFISKVMGILRILISNESTAQYVWNSMMMYSRPTIIPLSGMEILCLCAENGAQPTDKELLLILSWTDAISMNEKLTVAFLKTLVALHRKKKFSYSLQFLGDFHVVSQEMLRLGRQLLHAVCELLKSYLESRKRDKITEERLIKDSCYEGLPFNLADISLIDCFIWISHKQDEILLQERFFEDSHYENWLLRSPLHLAVIFLNEENSFKCLPQNMIQKYMDKEDLHGCTPLHLAYLHQNQQAVRFLISHVAVEDVIDKFGMIPKSLESSDAKGDSVDDKYRKKCRSILEAKCGVLELMKPMLVLSEAEGETLCDELKTLFQRLVQGTQFESAKIVMCGSMRERLKVGCFNEADIQLQFECNIDRKELLDTLVKRLNVISWKGIYLRPIYVNGPWKFIQEGISSYPRMTVSVDVVAVNVYEYLREPQQDVLRNHRYTEFCMLETWKNKEWKETYFAYEWDMIDSLPTSYRLAIVIAKALVQAYDLCRGDTLYVKMPITSYMIKTALFFILAKNTGQLQFGEDDGPQREIQVLKSALETVVDNESVMRTRPTKLKYNPKPQWTTEEDVFEHGEEARVLTHMIFKLIKCLVEQDWKLKSYWDIWKPLVEIGDIFNERFREAEHICEVCDCVLERLDRNTYYS